MRPRAEEKERERRRSRRKANETGMGGKNP